MLKSLKIKNIALISELELEFSSGLTVLSGETGAGKSIIIDSLNLLLGAKADRTLIRSGQSSAFAEGFFVVDGDISDKVQELGIEADGGEILIHRSITSDGKTECRINGRLVTLTMLRSLSALMVDIHGQHEHQSLLKPANHIQILDDFGGDKILKTKEIVTRLYFEYKSIQKELNSFGMDEVERGRTIDILQYQINEISQANLKEGEQEELGQKRTKFMNTERIAEAVSAALAAADTAAAMTAEAYSALYTAAKYDPDINPLNDRLNSAAIEISDITESLKDYIDNTEFDRTAADKVEQRLEIIRTVLKKYGGSVPSALDFCAKASAELERLTKSDDLIARLTADKERVFGQLMSAAQNLSNLRKDAGKEFERRVMSELSDLSMAGSVFEVSFNRLKDSAVTALGVDEVEFYLSANIGNPPKPLAKIISGGEMSRFMLALKNITATTDGIETLIFDEIDTGVSGKVGQVVAQKLATVALRRQVITITHLSSIAAMADNVYYIYKETDSQSTYTRIKKCGEDDIIKEIARLSGAEGVSDLSQQNAANIRKWSLEFKAAAKI